MYIKYCVHVVKIFLTTFWGKLMFKRSLLSLVMVLSCTAALASDNGEAASTPGRFAAVTEFAGKCWNSDVVTAAFKMVNPFAYTGACKEMYKAGFKGALPELWANHKPVIAGTVVVTAAAVVAYSQGWFSKAKTWVQEKLA